MSAGRTVIVTGGSRGLGAGLVGAFLAAGDRVATCSRTATPQTDAWASDSDIAPRFLHMPVDLADRAQCAAFVNAVHDRFDSIDVLVNNAGVARDGVIALFSEGDTDEVVDLNLKGTIHMTKLVVRRMLQQHSGRIVNVSSIVGLSGYRGLSVYAATKAALDGFSRALARELGSRGITVNSVAPGIIDTDNTAELLHGTEDGWTQAASLSALGRVGATADVADVVAFLASDGGRWVTGSWVDVTGGSLT
jgi:3-oxoacyl-[acyl-carrier protein] reductase